MNTQVATPVKTAISALDKRDAEVRKMLLSSYGFMTAEKILLKLTVRLTPKVLKLVIQEERTFYYHLLKLPAMIIFNGLVYDRAHDMQTLLQERMVDYLYSDEAQKTEEEPGHAYRAEMEDIRLKLVDFNNDFREFTEESELSERQILTYLRDSALDWAELCDNTSETICQELTEDGYKLPDYFKLHLSVLMRQEGLGISLPSATYRHYGLSETPNFIEKSIAYLLSRLEESA